MKKILSLLFAVALLFPMQGIKAQDKVVNKIIELGQTDNQSMQLLDVLSNRFGGRIAGSDALENAYDWAEAKFKEWGMETYREHVATLPVGFNRGPWFGRLLDDQNGMTLHFATPSYTSGTKGVQRGHVLKEPKTRQEFESMKGALKGAWVLITGTNTGWPIDWSATGDSIRASVIEYNAEAQKKNTEIQNAHRQAGTTPKEDELIPLKDEPALFYKEMVEAGILGIIQASAVPIRALYDRKNLEKMTFETLPTIPDIKLDESQYAIIKKMVEERRYFELEFDIRNHFKMGPVEIINLIGVIKGSKYPNEYVMMGGHLDSFDSATGGVDDGSGATPTMEAARLIMAAGGKPKRSILVCLWTAEEFGLWGSKKWVENHTKDLPKISNYFNRDMGPTVASGLTVPPAMYDDFKKICEPLNSINPDFPFTLKKREGEPGSRPTTAGGSDHAYFAMNGVPTLQFDIPDSKGYNFNYQEIWHTERDTYNKSIPEYQEHSATVTAVVVYGVANLDHILSREGLYKDE